jgi:hypothetical protein
VNKKKKAHFRDVVKRLAHWQVKEVAVSFRSEQTRWLSELVARFDKDVACKFGSLVAFDFHLSGNAVFRREEIVLLAD